MSYKHIFTLAFNGGGGADIGMGNDNFGFCS
jgi:hypothetical protein